MLSRDRAFLDKIPQGDRIFVLDPINFIKN